MENTKNFFLAVFIVGLVVFGAYALTHKETSSTTPFLGGAAGDTQSTPKMAQVSINSLASTTYASMTNTDARDRVITNIEVFEPAVGTTYSLTVATSTLTSCPTSFAALVYSTTTATTTLPIFTSTSTPYANNLAITTGTRVWSAGSTLLWCSNTTDATSTGGVFKVNYIAQ